MRSLELGHSESFSYRLTERIYGLRSPIGAHAWAAAPVVYRPLASRNRQSPGGCARKDEKEPRDAHVRSRDDTLGEKNGTGSRRKLTK